MLDKDGNDFSQKHTAHDVTSEFLASNAYLDAASRARLQGNDNLALALYIAAFEQMLQLGDTTKALESLDEAWLIAVASNRRSTIEYLFEKRAPYLTAEQKNEAYTLLNTLELEGLAQFGISRDDLESISEAIAQELGEHVSINSIKPMMTRVHEQGSQDDFHAQKHDAAHKGESAQAVLHTREDSRVHLTSQPRDFSQLFGFSVPIEELKIHGIGAQSDPELSELLASLQEHLGVDKASALGAIVFRSSSREDAAMLMSAASGELKLSSLRIYMQAGTQAMPILCMASSTDHPVRMHSGRFIVEGPGAIILEDFDIWAPFLLQFTQSDTDASANAAAQRVGREALALITTALADPSVFVFVSMGAQDEDPTNVYEMLDPMTIVDIYPPCFEERLEIFEALAAEHPALAQLDSKRLAYHAKNLSRYDIISAGKEAIESAYRSSLRNRRLCEPTYELLLEHIANYQPLESDEYRSIEEALVSDFRSSLSSIECEITSLEEPVKSQASVLPKHPEV